MVRPSYALNLNVGTGSDNPSLGAGPGQPRIPIFTAPNQSISPQENARRNLNGRGVPMPSDWGIDWAFFLDGLDRSHIRAGMQVPQPSYRIDANLAQPLRQLPEFAGQDPWVQHLAYRNLARGVANLCPPSGEQVAKALGEEPLSADVLWNAGSALPRSTDRYPHQLSGGMRQRVVIAMALSCGPKLLLADEPTTALDVTVQAQILELLLRLREEAGSSIVLVTHDLGVVAEVADRVIVMYGSRTVEHGSKDAVLGDPQHPYTAALLESILPIDGPRPPRLRAFPGSPPSPLNLAPGCAFAPRCPSRLPACAGRPALVEVDRHAVACFQRHPDRLDAA